MIGKFHQNGVLLVPELDRDYRLVEMTEIERFLFGIENSPSYRQGDPSYLFNSALLT